jgi:hypothetical protein
MEFTTGVTGVLFLVLFGVLAGGTLTSGMPTRITMMVLPGLLVVMALALLLGVAHGQYRERHSG